MILNMHALNLSRRVIFVLCLMWVAAAFSADARALATRHTDPPAILKTLRLIPSQVQLNGRYSSIRLLVDGILSGGKAVDLTSRVTLSVADPSIASIEDGFVYPKRDGSTTLTVRFHGLATQSPVVCRGIAATGPPRFVGDVMPIFTRNGCSSGACHGAASGKGGLKLSLLGYDPDIDYPAIARGAALRRIARTDPGASLLLRKPTLSCPHKGGKRIRTDSADYRILADWIARGMPGPDPDEPRAIRLDVTPSVRSLAIGQTQRFRVIAVSSDGSRRDVTSESVFTPSDETVASVSPDGEARVIGAGEAAVLVRFQSVVATARVVSPFTAAPSANLAAHQWNSQKNAARSPDSSEQIDMLVERKLAQLRLDISPRCSDGDFIRRAYLDVTGLLPTAEEARAFLSSPDPKKRQKLIVSLLDRKEYVDFWSHKWEDLLRSTRRKLSDKGMAAYNYWIRQSVADNKPWDQFARELLLATGGTFEVGPANYYRTAGTPQELAETTSQVFMGVRIQCAQCHNHPYEKWTQNQYFQLAAFFARVKERKGLGQAEQVVVIADNGEVTHPKTKKNVTACALDSQPVPKAFRGDRREPLVDWLTSRSNPFFARILVNRVWRHLMGRGLVEPVDDLRVTNPPSNAELFDFLADDFANHGFDVKRLIRTIMLSKTYQRSAVPVKGNSRDTRYYSHYPFKRLSAEQLMDALASATGVPEKFAGYPKGIHAAELADAATPSYFLDLFGRPMRNTSCECERQDDPNLGQVLYMMNDGEVNARIASKEGRVAKLIAAKLPDARLVEEIYLTAYSRYPTADESRKAIKAFSIGKSSQVDAKELLRSLLNPSANESRKAISSFFTAKTRQQAAEDLCWALLNNKEFVFNH